MAQPWSDGKIHGYYNVRGDLVLVNEGEEAPPGPGWTPVEWNQQGPQGEQGQTGPSGTTFTYIEDRSTDHPANVRIFRTIPCLPGFRVLSAGWRVAMQDGTGQFEVRTSMPADHMDGWLFEGVMHSTNPDTRFLLEVYVLMANGVTYLGKTPYPYL